MNDQELIDKAIACQNAGELQRAESIYWDILARQPQNRFVRHNLGIVLLAQGDYRAGPALVREVVLLDRNNSSLSHSLRNVGISLFNAGYWEAARDWLMQALEFFPNDMEIRSALDRSAPRPYLAPEVYDELNDQMLMRYSPRESRNYMYVIDIVGTCNLRCPTCPVGNFQDAVRSTGFMTEEMFDAVLAKIMTESPVKYPEIWLYSWGEPILHPKLPLFISKVKELGCEVHLSSNLNIKQTEKLEAIIRAAPTSLKISLSGFTPETYANTHSKGDFALLRQNMQKVAEFKAKHKVDTTVFVGQHIYKSNQADVPVVAEICQQLNFHHNPVAAFFQPLEKLAEAIEGKVEDKPILNDLIEAPSEYMARIKAGRQGRYDCELRFNQTVINHDGEVSLCCSVYDKQNMLGVSFLETPREKLEQLKYSHKFCKKCFNYAMEYAASEPTDRGERTALPPATIDVHKSSLTAYQPLIKSYHKICELTKGYAKLDLESQLEIDNQLHRNHEKLRAGGLFGRSLEKKIKNFSHEDDKTNVIPKIIHFIKTDALPGNFQLLHYLSIQSALQSCPDYRVILHSPVEPENALWDKLKSNVELQIGRVPQQLGGKTLFLAAHQSDVWRVDILLEQGGFYFDWDVILCRSLDDMLGNDAVMALEDEVMGYPEVMGVAFIGAQAGASFLKQWKLDMEKVYSPGCYTCHSTELVRRLALKFPEQVNVLEAGSFYLPGWTSAAASELFSENASKREELLNGRFKNSYGIHLFESHANVKPFLDRLTEASILNQNTCFNTLVRPYLEIS